MKNHTRFYVRVAAILCLCVASASSEAALVRGRLQRNVGNGYIGLAGIAVTVNSPAFGRSQPAFTDGNGMYFLQIPAGSYVLEVWIPNQPPLAFPIVVGEPVTDLVPVNL